VDLAGKIEDLKHKRALTVHATALALQEVYKLPGLREAPSKISQAELRAYNTELVRNSIINQTSDLHYYKRSD
jgi:hypothetical protein